MITYIIRRLVLAVIVLCIVSVLIFLVMRLLPGDPILLLLSQSQQGELTEEQLAHFRHEAGLDKTLAVQYFSWVGDLFRGDMGVSILTQAAVAPEIIRRVPITLYLGLLAFIIGMAIGLPVGIICAVRRGSFIDTALTALANIGITVPTFWLGVMLIYFFGLHLRWLPVQGFTSPFDNFWLSTKKLICLSFAWPCFPLRVTRARHGPVCWRLCDKTILELPGLKV
jgi:peptide/nickel transport system permease protein